MINLDSRSNNPSDNVMGAGISEEELRSAINASGYPLQAVVAERLSKAITAVNPEYLVSIQEEWSFIDSDTGSVRALDVLAEVILPTAQGARLRPTLDLLIECKQIELPTVFFVRPQFSTLGIDYPRLAGHPHDTIRVVSSPDSDRHILNLSWILGFGDHEFNKLPTPAVTMGRIHRKSKGLELSSEDTYPSIVRPLMKATDFFIASSKPHSARCYFDLRMVVSVAVIQGPMIGAVHTEQQGDGLTYVPWVRLHRLDPSSEGDVGRHGKPRLIDIVHASYLDSYCNYLLSFAQFVAKKIEKLTIPIIWGEGKIPKSREDDFIQADIAKILRPTITKQTFERELDERMYKAHRGEFER